MVVISEGNKKEEGYGHGYNLSIRRGPVKCTCARSNTIIGRAPEKSICNDIYNPASDTHYKHEKTARPREQRKGRCERCNWPEKTPGRVREPFLVHHLLPLITYPVSIFIVHLETKMGRKNLNQKQVNQSCIKIFLFHRAIKIFLLKNYAIKICFCEKKEL